MMGPSYYYYEPSPYHEDIQTEFHLHDCMWAGECCACPTRMSYSTNNNPMMGPQTTLNHGTVPITVGGTAGYVTLTPNRHEVPHKLIYSERALADRIAETEPEQETYSDSSSSVTPESSPRPQMERPQKATAKRTVSAKSSNSCSYSSSDNKKLRHREVEKNRHRQLQAMVKTLSEKIPGRLDKETQVQTMKRAARYCVYLRDVMESMSHGQSMMSKERLEKLYKNSYDSVELIMAQNGGAR